MPAQFTDQNFNKEVLKSKLPVLVDFWASWCGPCRKMSPVIDALAEELPADKIVVGKFNVEENQEVPNRYNIMSIPTVMIFKGGQPVDQIVGFAPREAVLERVKKVIGGK